jgi:hypothetical protein
MRIDTLVGLPSAPSTSKLTREAGALLIMLRNGGSRINRADAVVRYSRRVQHVRGIHLLGGCSTNPNLLIISLLGIEYYKIAITKWLLQNGCYRMAVTKWLLQNGCYKMAVTKWLLQNGLCT